MADVEKRTENLDELLKPFYHRASQAEDRLAKLEALFPQKGDSGAENKDLSYIINEYQSKLDLAQAELKSEREKDSKEIKRLETENQKLQYRILHLLRALKEADSKTAPCMEGPSDAR